MGPQFAATLGRTELI